jgi:DnaK suppressor protein
MNTPLTTQQRTLLEAELKAQLNELERQVSEQQAGKSRVEFAAELLREGTVDAMHGDTDREVALDRADREQHTLGLISRALARIHEPDYGMCADCGEAIVLGRLKLEPWALRCVACESAHEGHTVRHTL